MSKKAETIKDMFSQIAHGYDKANDVLSLGIHHRWRKKLVRLSRAQPGESVLDCATGTGDLAIEFKKFVGRDGQVVGSDFCREMLQQAPVKAQRKELDIHFEWADVTDLPYPDEHFDITSIAFGIRNVENPSKALQELYRVLKPGGRLMILEFGQPPNKGVAKLYDFYSRKVLPRIGSLITGNKQAYEYLESSASEFPCREAFSKMICDHGGFRKANHTPLSGGIAYIYRADK